MTFITMSAPAGLSQRHLSNLVTAATRLENALRTHTHSQTTRFVSLAFNYLHLLLFLVLTFSIGPTVRQLFLHEIRVQYGEEIAWYFAFNSHFLQSLWIPAIFGFITQLLIQVLHYTVNDPESLWRLEKIVRCIFGLIVTFIWGPLVLILWDRNE